MMDLETNFSFMVFVKLIRTPAIIADPILTFEPFKSNFKAPCISWYDSGMLEIDQTDA